MKSNWLLVVLLASLAGTVFAQDEKKPQEKPIPAELERLIDIKTETTVRGKAN